MLCHNRCGSGGKHNHLVGQRYRLRNVVRNQQRSLFFALYNALHVIDALFSWRTVEQNIFLPLEVKKRNTPEMRAKAVSLAEKYGLKDFPMVKLSADTAVVSPVLVW